MDKAAERRRRRNSFIMAIVAAMTVLVPFLFWKQTWFGEPLTEEKLAEYLTDTSKPRQMQHALVQIAERIESGDRSVEKWYPQVAAMKASPAAELRVTLAWALGADNRSELFHQTLLELLHDPELLVRRNAALSLVRFDDDSGRGEILQMMEPSSVSALQAGVLRYRAAEGSPVEVGTVVARLEQGETTTDIRSPFPGTLLRMDAAEGATVAAGQRIATLGPADDHLWEALRALLLIGRPEDLPSVERFADKPDLPENIREQAKLTAAAIRKRQAETGPEKHLH
jgi:biotin carboxyl carrier protein